VCDNTYNRCFSILSSLIAVNSTNDKDGKCVYLFSVQLYFYSKYNNKIVNIDFVDSNNNSQYSVSITIYSQYYTFIFTLKTPGVYKIKASIRN
jgi:hypothetical protein